MLVVLSTTFGLLVAGVGYYYVTVIRRRPSPPLSPDESALEFNELITPERCISSDGNDGGRSAMYGGELLASMDLAAASCAFRHTRRDGLGYGLVTLSIDSVKFVDSAYAYELLHLRARLNAVFNTSMEVEVIAQAENVYTGTFRDICIGRLVFVRLGGRPLPKLLITNDDDRQRMEQATKRKERSKEEAQALHLSSSNEDRTERLLQEFEKEWNAEADTSKKDTSKPKVTTEMIPMEDTRVVITKIVMPQHANNLGYTFGGQVLAWMELAATVSAVKCTRTGPLITVGLDRMKFRKGVKVGSLLQFHAQVNRVFSTSIEVGVRVEGIVGKQHPIHCNTGYFTFTLFDAKTKKSKSIPRHVRPMTNEDKVRYYSAGKRRENRFKEKSE